MEREETECLRNMAYDLDAIRNDRLASLLQNRQENDMRLINKAINEFRSLHQQPHSRREFDLYDPDALKRDKPGRIGDQDTRCGIASIQKFSGEDLNGRARDKIQKDQMRDWLNRQIIERVRAETAQRQAER
ncbi:unnamed protein product [Protopolystoma xenopodis]|uniref:Uncharacterized protein n=1 Tax=Protopolystoma xenopodis TaxID=117903 RepID=A0A448XIL3_9PLAT|nr:unnamed protein product [Protopolystoma xenopodis]